MALAGLDEAVRDQINRRFSSIFLNGPPNEQESFKHFQNGLPALRTFYEQAIAVIMKEFPE